MARLHSDLGQRTVYLPNGLSKAQGLPCLVYKTPPGTPSPQLANLATYVPEFPDTPGPAIPGAALTVDAYSNRPAFWDLDDLDTLWITVNGGPLVPITPDPQPQITTQDDRLAALEPGGENEAATTVALAAEATARTNAINAAATAAALDATTKANAAQAAAALDATAKANAAQTAAAADATAKVNAATLSAGAAAQSARRAGIADRALLGSGGWIIKRRNVGEYRLMREVGDGFVADHQLVRDAAQATPGPTAGPAGEARPLLLNDIGIGVPMIPVTFDAATYAGTGWATVAGYFSSTFPTVPTVGLDAAFPTVTTTAGSTTVTITSAALTPPLRYNTRRVVIPGAGAGGADLVTSVGAMAANGLSFTVGTAASTAVTGATATIWPGRRSTSSAGATATWTAPVGATSVGMVYGLGSNGGFSTVSIDGDLTRATFLPTAQQLVDTGVAPSTILVANGGTVAPTSRILDFYHQSELFTSWQAFASGLDPAVAHTVVVTSTAYKRAASVSTRIIVSGFGYGTATTGPRSANALPFIAIRAGKSSPVHELAIDHKPTGLSASVFVGGHNHGYEWENSALEVVVDGTAITLTDDQSVPVVGSATLVRRTSLYHTQNTVTPTMTARTSYRLDRTGLVMNVLLDAKAETTVDSVYFGSYTAPHTLSRVQVDKDSTVYNLDDAVTYPEGTYVGTGFNTGAVWWQPGGEVVAAVLVPTAKEQTGGWSDGFVYASVRNFPTTSQSSKWYARRKGLMVLGAKWAGEVTYIIGRLPDGVSNYFPVI